MSSRKQGPVARLQALINDCDELPEGRHKQTIQERARKAVYSASGKGIKQLVKDLEDYYEGDEQAEIMMSKAEQGLYDH